MTDGRLAYGFNIGIFSAVHYVSNETFFPALLNRKVLPRVAAVAGAVFGAIRALGFFWASPSCFWADRVKEPDLEEREKKAQEELRKLDERFTEARIESLIRAYRVYNRELSSPEDLALFLDLTVSREEACRPFLGPIPSPQDIEARMASGELQITVVTRDMIEQRVARLNDLAGIFHQGVGQWHRELLSIRVEQAVRQVSLTGMSWGGGVVFTQLLVQAIFGKISCMWLYDEEQCPRDTRWVDTIVLNVTAELMYWMLDQSFSYMGTKAWNLIRSRF